MLRKTFHSRRAFTFIELLLYIAIAMFIILPLMSMTISMMSVRLNSQRDREVNENMRFVMSAMSKEIHDAESLNAVTATSLTLNKDTEVGGTVNFATDTKIVNGQTITTLEKDGVQITSDLVDVTSFTFTDLTRATEQENIQIEITLSSLDGSSTLSVRTAVSLRE